MAEWSVPGYTPLKTLGSGGFGQVMLARHDATGTLVAIKYLRHDLLADQGFAEMFRAEAAVLASLDDPNIVRLYEYVESPAGAAIVMELVDGVSVREILGNAGSTTAEAALVVLYGSLLGLGSAHRRGVVHRDYKPENVLVNGEGVSKLTDFGIAARTGDHPLPAGTLLYVAPEQMAGAPASPASDVYSATATFYECLTGRPPFTGDAVQLLYKHSAESVPLEPVPEPLRPLVAAGMAKDPQSRPADAASFVTSLQAVAAGAYGQDWADRGRFHLGEAALLLAALWPSAAATATQGATVYRLSLLRRLSSRVSPLRAVIAAVIAGVVVAGGVAVAAGLSHSPRTGNHHVAAHRTTLAPKHAAGLPGDIIFQTTAASSHHAFWKTYEIGPNGPGGRLLPIGGALCCSSPALSPDGTKLVFTGEGTIDVTDLNGHPANGVWSRSPAGLATPTGAFLDPTWSPSGNRIAFIYSPGSGQSPEIDVINADGTGRRRVIQGSEISLQGALAWSPDGTQLAFATTPTGTPIPSGTIAVVRASGGLTHTLVTGVLDGVTGLSWAPGPQPLFTNGHEPGIWEADGHGSAKIVVQCGVCLDTHPSWAPDGVHFAAARQGHGVIVGSVDGGVQARIGPADVIYVEWGGPAGTASPSPSVPAQSTSPPSASPAASPSSTGGAPPGYSKYRNPRYGFTTLWPSAFRAQPPPANGDGQGWVSTDGRVSFSAYGTNNVLNYSPQQDAAAVSNGLSVVYRNVSGNIVTISGYKNSGRTIVYQRDVVGSGSIDTLYWSYPAGEKTQWAAAVTLTVQAFRAGDIATAH
jgi:tRNA A-37 threonylcarbamoyl transferase component Bud32